MTGYGEVYYGVHQAAVNYPAGVGSGAYRVSIQKKAYVGGTTPLLIGAHSQMLKQEPEKKQKFFKYSSTSLGFRFVELEALSLQEFYTEDDREWCLEYTKDGNLIYRGWIFGQNIKEKYFNEEYTFEIIATDGIKELANIPFVDVDGQPFAQKLTCLQILVEINRLIGLDLPISTMVPIFDSSTAQNTNILTQIKPEQQRYAGMNCREVLDDLCILFGANFYQNDGKLYFERFTAETEGASERHNYTSTGTFINTTTLPAAFEIAKDTSHVAVWPTIEVDIEPAVEEVSVDYVFEPTDAILVNRFLDIKEGVGYATTETVLNVASGYSVFESNNNFTVLGWGAVNTPNMSYKFLTDEANSAVINAGIRIGASAPSWLVVNGNGHVISEPTFLQKEQVLKIKVGSEFMLNPTFQPEVAIKIVSKDGVVNYYNKTLKTWQTTEYFFTPVSDISLPLGYLNPVPNLGSFVGLLNLEITKLPFECYLYGIIRKKSSLSSGLLQSFIIEILASNLAAERERHTANNIKNHTKTLEIEEVAFSDESMGYLPTSLWNGNVIAGSFYKKNSLKPYKLIDLAVETVFQQYHRPSLFVYLDYLGVKLNVGERITFSNTYYPKLSNRVWKVTSNRSYNYETMMGSGILHEVLTDFAEYDRNNQVIDKDGKTIHIVSDRIESGTSVNIAPWTWVNIGGATGSAARILNTYLITANGQDIWGQSDNFGYLYRTGGNTALEGVLSMPTADSSGGTIATNAKVGIMYRESLNADSKFFAIVRQKDGYVMTFARETTGGPANVIQAFISPTIEKFKVTNDSGALKAYYHNGAEWVAYGAIQMNMPTTAKIGFCFAMIGDTAGVFVNNAVFGDNTVILSTKPTNLQGAVITTKAEATSTGQSNKPSGLVPAIVTLKASGVPVISTGGTTGTTGTNTAPNTTGFAVFTQDGKDGMGFYHQGYNGPKTRWMQITGDTVAGTITDTAWSYNPTPFTKIWKIDEGYYEGANTIDGWRTDALTNIPIPANLRGKELTVTIKWYNPTPTTQYPNSSIYNPYHNFQQQFILN